MAKVIAGATVSLDGFVQDAHGSAAALYADFEELGSSAYMRALQEETGAVLMGRRTFDMAEDPDDYADNYEFQVPIFVVTHEPPPVAPKSNERLSITFVTDGVEAAGLVDELSVDIMPVLLGGGLRLFEGGPEVTLEKVSVQEVGVRTALRYRVVR